ncbi:hypothetical protein HYV81_04865 [Candidatus Woesearchaeota archaeon]|nr:hypothetical protein [Candidatus Woesearchaeota archaeon]
MKQAIGILILLTAVLSAAVWAEYATDSTNIVLRDKQNFSGQEKGYSLVNQDPDPAEPGSLVDIRFKIENTGGEPAENFIFEILPEFPFKLGDGQSAQVNLGTIYGRQIGEQGAIVHYRLLINKDAVEGDNLLNVRYSTDNGQTWTRPRPFAIRVQSHDAVIGIDKVTVEPELVRPGGTFKLSFLVVNHASALLKNIRVMVDLGAGDTEKPFSPIGGSNEKVIGNMDGKEGATLLYTFAVDADAESKAYRLPVEIKYVDRQGKNFTKQNVIGILIGEEPELSVAIQSTEVYTSGKAGAIVLKVVNKGTSDIKFLNLKIEPTEEVTVVGSNEMYIGELDSDDFSTAEFKVYVKSDKDKVAIPVRYEFKDSNNNPYSRQASLELPLYSASEARKMGLAEGNLAIGIAIILAILAAGYFVFRRWRKTKAHK